MFNLLVGSFGFRATFRVTFEKIVKTPLGNKVLPLPTTVPISGNFFEAEATVRMNSTGSGSTFDLTITGFDPGLYALLDPKRSIVHLSLGYADGTTEEVIAGILTKKHLTAGESFYEAHLEGMDATFYPLLYPSKKIKTSYANKTVKAIVTDICTQSGVTPSVTAEGPSVESISFNDLTPIEALRILATKYKLAFTAKDGKFWFGDPATLGSTLKTPLVDGATGQPIKLRTADPDADPVDGYDIAIAGIPSLRPFDLVTIQDKSYRVESVNHTFKGDTGYQCQGRVVSDSATPEDVHAASKGGPAQVARQLREGLAQREKSRPSVSAGEVSNYTAGQHKTTVEVGHQPTPDMVSPSVEAPLRKDPVPLPDKPMASPFAFHKCGLVVPVYPKMRTLLVHALNDPNDAIIDGFLWAKTMTSPANQAGDWWLCLPTQFDGDSLPTGSGVDDLTDQNGQRVIQVKGLKITVGSALLNPVGSRPTPNSDESLTIETDQGAKVTVKGSTIEMSAGGVTFSLGNGTVSVK